MGLLKYLEPELFALCVEPNTFLSKAILKLHKKYLYRNGRENAKMKKRRKASEFFSRKNMIFLAISNKVFNKVYRRAHKSLPEDEKDEFEIFRGYIQTVGASYNIWDEIRTSRNVHEQMNARFPAFLGLPNENIILDTIRNQVSCLCALPVIQNNKRDLRQYKCKVFATFVWIAASVIYADAFFRSPRGAPLEVLVHAIVLTIAFLVDVLSVCLLLPEIFDLLQIETSTEEIMKRNKFINAGETPAQKRKLIKTLLFLDD